MDTGWARVESSGALAFHTCRRASDSSRSTTRRSRDCERRSRANTHDSAASAAELIAKLVSDSVRSGAPSPPAAARMAEGSCAYLVAGTNQLHGMYHLTGPSLIQ